MKQKLFLGAQQEHVVLHRLASGQVTNVRQRYATVHIRTVHIRTGTVHICTRTVLLGLQSRGDPRCYKLMVPQLAPRREGGEGKQTCR